MPRHAKSMRQKRGLDARSGRKERLKVKHAKREARAAEMHRVAALTVVTRFSQLRSMPNGDLSDQLKYHKQVREKKGFTVTFPARKGYVLQLHALVDGEAALEAALHLAHDVPGVRVLLLQRGRDGVPPRALVFSGALAQRVQLLRLHVPRRDHLRAVCTSDELVASRTAGFHPVEGRASPPHRAREDALDHLAETSITNLADALGVLSRWRLSGLARGDRLALERGAKPTLSRRTCRPSARATLVLKGFGGRRETVA